MSDSSTIRYISPVGLPDFTRVMHVPTRSILRVSLETNMSRQSRLLILLISALFSAVACQPIYVQETYRESYAYGPTYGAGYGAVVAPAVIVREPVFVPGPVIVEKKTIIRGQPPPMGVPVPPVRSGHCDRRQEKCWRSGGNRHAAQPG